MKKYIVDKNTGEIVGDIAADPKSEEIIKVELEKLGLVLKPEFIQSLNKPEGRSNDEF